ncbi:HU family DNA-binding protein [Sulfitobacter sp. PR48]|uniref:HU family DNA-binding protein n=1 Tax=unclassified Sulfitobacter TaxID=196795 RepID=UPI0022AF9A01|nr:MULTISPECIES: HU family DNA-binding protein [unclassified Sulfitobacter]MCZ4257771.1 HU family DNA-binding protein [Sulfitobacter sp. G21635-S1]MDD9723040.1 HU family DNA-binding protein [Sulfitobacter sp. PR48]
MATKSSTPAPVTAIDGKAPAAAAAATPTVVEAPQSVILGPVMRKKELIDQVVKRSGIKKKDAKPVVESLLSVLGEALADNRELVLPPFGKVKVRREKQMPNGRVMVVKVRQSAPPQPGPSDKLPDAAE